jgi:uncharacterized membrane protein required for colicin V production
MGTTVGLILTFFFIGILIIGFLIGLWRGFKKASVNLAFSIVGIVIAFLITPLIASQAVSVTVTINGVKQTLSDFIMSQITSGSDMGILIQNNPNIEVLLTKLPLALVSSIVFILLTLIIEFVIYIIYKIIAVIFLKTKPGKKKHRLLGGAVGTLRAFLLTIFAVMPLASIVGLVDDINKADDIFVQTAVAEEYNGEREPKGILDRIEGSEQALGVINSINNSAFFALGGLTGLDDLMFDYLSSFDLQGENVKIRQEIVTYATTANVVIQIQDELSSENPVKFASIDFEKLEMYVNNVLDSKLFSSIVCELASDILKNYRDYSFATSLDIYSDILDDIGQSLENVEKPSVYFSKDIKQLFNAFKSFAQNGIIDELKDVKVPEGEDSSLAFILENLKVLTSNKNLEPTAIAFNEILTTNTLGSCKDSLSVFISNQINEEKQFFDISQIEGVDAWKNELKYVGQLTNQLADKNSEGKLLIDVIFESENPAEAILELEKDKLVGIIKPMLYSKFTNGVKDMLFDSVNALADEFGASESKLSTDKFIFEEGNVNDQAQQVCDIFVSLVKLAKECKNIKDSLGTLDIKEIDVELIGEFIYEIVENPAFNEILEGIANKVEENIPDQYRDQFNQKLEEVGAENLAEFVKSQETDMNQFVDMFKEYFAKEQVEIN